MAAATDSSFLRVTYSLGIQFLPEPFQPLTCLFSAQPLHSAARKEGRHWAWKAGGQNTHSLEWRLTGPNGEWPKWIGNLLIKNLGMTNTSFMDTNIQKMLWILWLGHNIWLCTYEQALFEASRCCIGKTRMQDVKKAQLMDENWLFLPQMLWDFRITLTEATEKRTPCYIPQKAQLNLPWHVGFINNGEKLLSAEIFRWENQSLVCPELFIASKVH